MNDNIKYMILVDSDPPVEVHPNNDSQVTFTWEKQDDEKVFYERKLKGDLKFTNNAKKGITDFDYFYSYEINPLLKCKTFILQIFELCDKEYVLDWQGKFSLTDADWDLDKCILKVKVVPDTLYTCIKNNRVKEVNILDVPNIISTGTTLDYNYEFYYCIGYGTSCTLPGVQTATWTLFYQNLNYPYIKNCVSNNMNFQIYYREAIITSCVGSAPNPPPGAGWLLEANNCVTLSTSKYVRTPLAGSTPYASQVAIGWYNFLLGQEELPPYPKFKSLVVSNTPPSENIYLNMPTICRLNEVGTQIDYFIEVINNVNSTYAWTLDGTSAIGAIITSVGNKCKITPNTNLPGVIKILLTETHGNAYVSTKNYLVNQVVTDTGVLSPDVTLINFTIKGPTTCCKNQTGLVFQAVDTPVVAGGIVTTGPVWAVTGGATINSGQGTNQISVTAGATGFILSYSYQMQYTVGINTVKITLSNTFYNVAMSSIPTTNDIDAVVNLYPSETPSALFFQKHNSATAAWYDTSSSLGAGIDVGSINALPFIAPASPGTYCFMVKETLDCGCTSYLKIAPATVDGALGFFPPVYWCAGSSISSAVNYTRNRSFKEVVEYVMDQLECSIASVVSDFFDWNSVGDAPGYSPGINYVTGSANKLTNITIAQKSDIISYLSSNAATKGMITLDKLEKIWAWLFNAYWFIDAFGRFRIEHISFFNRTVGYNANALPHKPYNVAKNKYSYNKSKMPKFEQFKCAEMMFTDFIGTAIFYDSICVNQDSANNTQERFLDFVTTDLYALYIDPANANKLGFVLICNDVIGTIYTVNQETGSISSNTISNGHLSWANLHVAYHKYNRILKQGFMNNILTTFVTVKPSKQQKDIAIKVCCEDTFDPLIQLYKTELGNGILEEGEENKEKGIIKMTLLHE